MELRSSAEWQAALTELRRKRWTFTRIAAHLGASEKSVRRWAKGATKPITCHAEKLIEVAAAARVAEKSLATRLEARGAVAVGQEVCPVPRAVRPRASNCRRPSDPGTQKSRRGPEPRTGHIVVSRPGARARCIK